MEVRLSNYSNMENPIQTIYLAYRLCYCQGKQCEIKIPINEQGEIDYNKMSEFIIDKMKLGHTTPLEHVSFTFEISGVSRALTHQLVRHRTGKFNQQSQRYVRLGQFEYVIPPTIENVPKAREIFIEQMEMSQKAYDLITNELVDNYISSGISKKKAEKMAIEDARYVFPNACASNITVTMDLNNFRNFYRLRNCVHAQWEIRELAKAMGKLVTSVIPFALKDVMDCNKTCFDCFLTK